ncbi:helix-turn-helix domain-containing protein [Tahibacter amnicola]|jgi:transcriptional regulator with XRE-family HTH domain|uniref:Helix-turn-helix transcriptional regulator n=1 Tax=Tahibacter amnicola TaxID=2976241 RepID=A0ABY6B8Y8_9GAMM|nr:helix-turn-helix transcriptional regulator [Tahibacter amnicola]UXI66022.1 helix-turn-helix transcriptional regulator [Tahibacter amnicola]
MATDTFGTAIAAARRAKGLSQKELAERVKLADDTGNVKSISPQYLNDIEHDRRSPSSAQLVTQFSRVLDLNADYLAFLADRWPDSLRRQIKSEEDFTTLVTAFRKQAAKAR